MNHSLYSQLPPEQQALYAKECAALHKRYTSFLKHSFLEEYLACLDGLADTYRHLAINSHDRDMRDAARGQHLIYKSITEKGFFRDSYIAALDRIGRKYERYHIQSDNPASENPAHAESGGSGDLPLL